MKTVIYTERRTFEKFDKEHVIGYLNEEVIPDYVPETAQGQQPPEPTTGYAYTVPMKDGGTVMPCTDASSYPEVTNAIIRSKYSESEEMAIHRHFRNDPEGYVQEWKEYNDFCEAAKVKAKEWLGIE